MSAGRVVFLPRLFFSRGARRPPGSSRRHPGRMGAEAFVRVYVAAVGVLSALPWLYGCFQIFASLRGKKKAYTGVPHAGLEPATSRLEGERAIQLRQWDSQGEPPASSAHLDATDYVEL